jgi:hypothetical protein
VTNNNSRCPSLLYDDFRFVALFDHLSGLRQSDAFKEVTVIEDSEVQLHLSE